MILLFMILIVSFLTSIYFYKKVDYRYSGRVAMSVMLISAALGHFFFTKDFIRLVPSFITTSLKLKVVIISSLTEIIIAFCLLFLRNKKFIGKVLILSHIPLMFVVYKNNTISMIYKIPIHLFFIYWIYIVSIKKNH